MKTVPWLPPTRAPGATSGRRPMRARTAAPPAPRCSASASTPTLRPSPTFPGSRASAVYRQGRTWSFDAHTTARLATAFAVGLADGHALATMKHFPGLGLATADTDRAVVHITASRSRLEPGLDPYRSAIAAHVPVIMLSNAVYDAYDRTNAAGWSRAIATGLLRNELGFDGRDDDRLARRRRPHPQDHAEHARARGDEGGHRPAAADRAERRPRAATTPRCCGRPRRAAWAARASSAPTPDPAAEGSARASLSSEIRIREGRESDFERLRVIAVEAKAHWGYDRDLVEEWAHGGDFEPESLRRRLLYVAEEDGSPVGWAALIPRGEVGWLEDLWVEPAMDRARPRARAVRARGHRGQAARRPSTGVGGRAERAGVLRAHGRRLRS